MHPEISREAALALCELTTTKNVEIQDLLINQNPGKALVSCLQHTDPDVKRSAIIAVERWLYGDDRMIQFTIEFFLTMARKGTPLPSRFY
jgi:vesicle coat complex subunit